MAENCDDTKINKKSDDDSTIPPLISEEEMDVMSSGDDSDAEPMSKEMLEDIRDSSQSNPSINRREERYKICGCIKPIQAECKGENYLRGTWVKV